MNIWEMLYSAVSSLNANKLRSILTMLGILIGVASIICIIAIGSGGKAAIISTIESTRVQNTIQILPSAIVQTALPQAGQVAQFTTEDFQLAREFSGVNNAYYTLYGQANVQAQSAVASVSVDAGPSFLNDIGHFIVVSGRMYQDADVIAHRPVVLVSQSLAQKLFGNQNPLGKTLLVQGTPLQIIGAAVSTQPNLLSGLLGTDYIYMPGTTCLDLFPWWSINEMDVEVQPGVDKTELARRLVMALNIHAHDAGAFVDSTGLFLGIEHTIGTVTSILTLVIGAVAGIALLVGGVGVMNIMLVSVTERTQEIGIRMSLGATRRNILYQFLLESAAITTAGGMVGIVLGVLGANVVYWTTGFPVSVPWLAIVGSFLFSAVIGLLCGIYPANKAARLNPIDALRYE